MGDEERILVRVAHGMEEVSPAEWDACANPQGASYNPFISHAFLSALEESGSATPRTGWAPYHLVIEDEAGAIAGCMPMYLKNHSQGEYVFDYGWADAFERAGGRYYPKLQVSVPFTPATGRRLLAKPGPAEAHIEKQLLAGAMEAARQLDVSSIHFTFLPKEQWEEMGKLGLLQRTDQQFHWLNDGYETFDDFLSALASRKRKNLRKERERARESDIEIEWVTGSDLTEDHWDAFFEFYMDTGARKWGTPYLTREFFSLVSERIPEDILLIMAKRGGRYIAGALNFIGSDTLFGRNWGAIEHHPFLHFECCYYQAIDFAISRGLKRVEAGAQGAHKLARGYLPAHTYSAHHITHPGLRQAVADYLERERAYIDEDIEMLGEHAPFRHDRKNS
ncbi:GNAT family N-acetyltransferase [Tepidicaulis sp. LMO-SS28]|uniref:GNAT family N-acetyltransferase n=1 Tax=Tepidicaulis sp. LMO-SS28 TaxID=3447455 RepID=UPI003EDF88BB